MQAIQIAQGWRDYILIDAGDGEKLERWGDVTVIRPDPQAIWPRTRGVDWGVADMRYHRSKAGGGHWEMLRDGVPSAWSIAYDRMRFHIRPTGFKHMGLFPEQGVNWRWMQERIRSAGREVRVLNLFAYTGGATVACLQAGAHVTHIDAAKGMNQWARDNVTLSGMGNVPHRVLTDDVLKFVHREGRRGNRYDAIVMDPPVFGRGPGGEMWKLEDKLVELVTNCARLLSDAPLFVLINAYTAGYSPAVYGNILAAVFGKKAPLPSISTGEVGLLAKSGLILPCGMYARACLPSAP
ncbi:MAG: class I SAM-dependent methyltransferase [Defluviitaleaceae bacterium]|nr:class I SAM-dependent methyltransferase [Defluviitaleaceae bacterium]MCL2239827.1 class I SAM-dependent methyltransferase [Defluviitaleaceae bacterium]